MSVHTNAKVAMGRCGMKKPASGKQSQLDDEQEHARLGQPGWHERRIRDVSPGGSLIACSSRLIVKLLLTGAGLKSPEKVKSCKSGVLICRLV